ncbi:MAG TPA: fibronectin type III domain-containing protein [Chitinophagales bacterium]|nr:fibronectin type III domain-containing protein [Chitinophagales bacterium]
MKTSLLIAFILFSYRSQAQLTAIHTSPLGFSSVCAGESFDVSFTTTGTANPNNIFTAQISGKNGSFSNAQEIGSMTGQTGGTISCGTSSLMTQGTGYRVRVVSSDPVVIGSNNGSNITLNAYCSPPSNITAGNITSTSALISWSIPVCYNSDNYKVRYYPSGTANYTTVGSSTLSKQLNGLTPGIAYSYEVKTKITNYPGTCKWSATQAFTTPMRLGYLDQGETIITSIFPNPFTQSATIIINGQGNFDFILCDVLGKEVMKREIQNSKLEIERGSLSPGIYFYHVEQKGIMVGDGKVVLE